MKKVYSNSKLWLYENCPEYYKIKYIDKTLPEIQKTINMFLGDLTHQSLEWLYNSLFHGGDISLDDLIYNFSKNWSKQFNPKLKIEQSEKSEDYFNKGVRYLINYYQKNKPFVENTIAIEKKIFFPLEEDYFIQGYIDRLVLKNECEYEVHDYKTHNNLKSQEEIDADRQLAFYHLGLQEIFGKNIEVKLIWHFLAHNKIVFSFRTQEQLEKLKSETLNLIKKIESTNYWPACNKKWCEWCEYKRLNDMTIEKLKKETDKKLTIF